MLGAGGAGSDEGVVDDANGGGAEKDGRLRGAAVVEVRAGGVAGLPEDEEGPAGELEEALVGSGLFGSAQAEDARVPGEAGAQIGDGDLDVVNAAEQRRGFR